jgi:tRNA1(Val) A37 N6-methylase TrmN6
VGIEAQEMSASLARRSILWNGVDDRCAVRSGDLRDSSALESLFPVDLVTGTPPYLPPGTGIESSRVQCGPCRFEHRGGVEQYCVAAARLLGETAPFVGCVSSKQRARVELGACNAGLMLETWRDVVPREGKAPLFSVFSMRRNAEGPCREQPPLVLRGRDGHFTEAFNALRKTMGMPV